MIGIQCIAGYIPFDRIDNLKRLAVFGVDPSFVTKKLGIKRIAVKEKSDETSDLCCRAVDAIRKKIKFDLSIIDCMVVCTQNPDGQGLPQTSAIVHNKIGLSENCATFDLSLGCSGYVYSLSVIQSFMTLNDLRNGLLITCDPYSKIVDVRDKSTSMLFGDASTATILSNNPIWEIGKAVFGTKGDEWQAIHVGPEGFLSMQGRAVFNFAATEIPRNIDKTLRKNNLRKEEIDLFALHQGSKFIIDVLRKRMGVSIEKMPFVAGEYGNTISSSIPLIIEKVDQKVCRILISGFGVGLSWASLVLQRRQR